MSYQGEYQLIKTVKKLSTNSKYFKTSFDNCLDLQLITGRQKEVRYLIYI